MAPVKPDDMASKELELNAPFAARDKVTKTSHPKRTGKGSKTTVALVVALEETTDSESMATNADPTIENERDLATMAWLHEWDAKSICHGLSNDWSPGLIQYLGELQTDEERLQAMAVLKRVKDDLGSHYEVFAQDDYAAVFKRMHMNNPKNGMSAVLCPADGCDYTFTNLKRKPTHTLHCYAPGTCQRY